MKDIAHVSLKGARLKTVMVVALWGFGVAWSPTRAVGQCCGDCNGDGAVTIDEIITGVNHALGSCIDDGICSMESCPAQLAMCQDELADSRAQCDASGVPTSGQDRVREVVSLFYAAFNSAFEGPADFATEDWNHISPTGGWTRGRENTLAVLRQVHSTFLSGVYRHSPRYVGAVRDVRRRGSDGNQQGEPLHGAGWRHARE
jgi:hypothetical protein